VASSRPRRHPAENGLPDTAQDLHQLKAMGFSDAPNGLLELAGSTAAKVTEIPARTSAFVPVYKRVDTCAAEFAVGNTLHVFDLRERRLRAECEAEPTDRRKAIIVSAAVRTGSARALSSTIAASTRRYALRRSRV
jgi:carbamoyl-phosphate synthase large subunit